MLRANRGWPPSKWPLETAQRAIVVSGCFGMAYMQLVTSPATVQFARSMGASGLHIGILGALPVGLVFMQLLAALAVRHLKYRKPLWFWVSIAHRLIFLPAALGPWLFPQVPDAMWIWLLIVLTGVNHAMLHFGTPLWLSWMGDYLPHEGLNRFWGLRQSTQQWTAALALMANAMFFFHSGISVRAAFAAIIGLSAVFGVLDIVLFIPIDEPPIKHELGKHEPGPRMWDILAAPFRQSEYRTFIWFSCYWNLAAMVGAPFISMFLLEEVGMDLFHVLLLWTISYVGGALLSNQLGRWTERFGQRPVLILCTAFKSLNMLALLVCGRDPMIAFWILTPVFMFDAFLNAGITIANNGFMIKNSPRANRTMFIAAGNAFAGMVGGITSVLAGFLIAASDHWSVQALGCRLVNFHVLFAVSVALRLVAVGLTLKIRDPSSATGTRVVVHELVAATRQRIGLAPRPAYLRHARRGGRPEEAVLARSANDGSDDRG